MHTHTLYSDTSHISDNIVAYLERRDCYLLDSTNSKLSTFGHIKLCTSVSHNEFHLLTFADIYLLCQMYSLK